MIKGRREFLTAAAAVGAMSLMPKYSLASGAADNSIKVGVVGLGTRGTGAVREALMADENVKITALADIFEDKMNIAVEKFTGGKYLKDGLEKRFDVPKERRFTGVDSLDKILATDIDVVLLCTPPVFRPYEMKKALDAGKHVFAEKPICVDAAGARYIENEVVPLAEKKGLCIAVGTQGRHLEGFVEGVNRLRDGQIGDIVSAQAFYYQSSYLEGWSMPKRMDPEDMEYQIRRWLAFIWISGDQYVEQHIHSIDAAMWALGDIEPVEVNGFAGRDVSLTWPYQGNRCSHFSVDYDFGNGLHLGSFCRQENNSYNMPYYVRIHGTKGMFEMPLIGNARISGEKPWVGAASNNALGQIAKQKVLYQAMRSGNRLDNSKALINSNWIAIAGRESAYAGKKFKYGWIKQSKQDFLPGGKYDLGKRAIDAVPSPSTYKLV